MYGGFQTIQRPCGCTKLHSEPNTGGHQSSKRLDLHRCTRSDTKKSRATRTHAPTSFGLALKGEYFCARASARAARPGVLGGMCVLGGMSCAVSPESG
jgi:hypothetical protein